MSEKLDLDELMWRMTGAHGIGKDSIDMPISEIGALIARIRELESASQPGGGETVLVPKEATEEMLNATRGKNCSPGTWNNWQKKRHATIYRQMIAAVAATGAGNGESHESD